MYLLKPTFIFLVTLLVAGCGGGGGDEPVVLSSAEVAGADSQSDAIQLRSGEATSVEGTVSSTHYTLESASWQVTEAYPSPAPAPTLGNSDCAVAVKDTWIDPVMFPDDRYGHSTWTCKVDVTAPNVTAETLYTLTLTGQDAAGNHLSLHRQVRVIP